MRWERRRARSFYFFGDPFETEVVTDIVGLLRGWVSGWVSGLGPASATVTVTLREWEKERVSEGERESVEPFDWWGRVSEWATERETLKFKNILLEIDLHTLGFQVVLHVSPRQWHVTPTWKSTLWWSIFRWLPPGNFATSDVTDNQNRLCESRFTRPKIDCQKVEMLLIQFLSKPDLLSR